MPTKEVKKLLVRMAFKERERMENLCSCVLVLHKTLNLVILRMIKKCTNDAHAERLFWTIFKIYCFAAFLLLLLTLSVFSTVLN